jgi:hypothetical protein
MMYHADDAQPQDQAADPAMTALYRELSQADLPGYPGFDTEAGLRDLTRRIRQAGQPAPASRADDKVAALNARPDPDPGGEPGAAPGRPKPFAHRRPLRHRDTGRDKRKASAARGTPRPPAARAGRSAALLLELALIAAVVLALGKEQASALLPGVVTSFTWLFKH